MNRQQRRKALDEDRQRFHAMAIARPGKDDLVDMVGMAATVVLMRLESLRLKEEFEKAKRGNESEGEP